MQSLRNIIPVTFGILLLWTCSSEAPVTRPSQNQMPIGVSSIANTPPKETPSAPLSALQVPPPQWRLGTAGEEARLALLVAADKYLEASWTIGAAKNNLVAMKQALLSSCAIASSGIKELSGTEVNRDAVRAGLADLGKQIKDRKGVLVVYWTGHGFVDAKGEARWFTHYTRELASGGYDNVISRAELAGWITEACGTNITPVIVADVCRPRINAPPPAATLEPLAMWEVQSTRSGRYSEAPPPDKASPFTRAFADSVTSLAQTGECTLDALFAETARRCKEATDNRQEPELIRPLTKLSDPGLVRSQRISIAVEAVDVISGSLIPALSLRLDARQTGTPADGAQRVEAAPGRHIIRLSAHGYCARVEEVDLTPAQTGSILRVALLPSLVRVSGTLEPAGVYGIRVRGCDQDVRENFHKMKTVSSDDGRFELRLPGIVTGVEIQVMKGEQILGRSVIPTSMDRYRMVTENGIEGIRTIDLGAIRLSVAGGEDAVAKVASGLSKVGVIPLPKELSDLPRSAPAELTSMERNRWDQAMRMVDGKRWTIALDQLQEISAKVPKEILGRWNAYILTEQAKGAETPEATASIATAPAGLAKQAVAAVVVARLLDGSPAPAALLEAAKLEEHLDANAQKVAKARRIALAGTALIGVTGTQLDPAVLLDWLVLGDGPSWDDAAWQAARLQAATVALASMCNQAVERGITSDDWKLADRAKNLARAFSKAAADASVVAALKRLEQERQPKGARLAFSQAQDSFASGDAATAYTKYKDALKAGANAHYRAQILPQVEYLRQQLFNQHLNTGLEHEMEGRFVQAAMSYCSARLYDFSAHSDINRLKAVKNMPADLAVALRIYDRTFETADDLEKTALEEIDAALLSASVTDLKDVIKRYPEHQRIPEAQRLLIDAEKKEAAATAAANRAFASGNRTSLTSFVQAYPQHARAEKARKLLKMMPSWSTAHGKDKQGYWADLTIQSITQRFRWIPAGSFTMGSNQTERDLSLKAGSKAEWMTLEREHTVTFTDGFWMADSECTQNLWKAVLGTNPAKNQENLQCPVEQVSWDDCQQFLKGLNNRFSGVDFRLPTEAEWEYACRAGSKTAFCYGGNLTTDQANYVGTSPFTGSTKGLNRGKTIPVKSLTPNAWGLYDMHGNVWEWCGDRNGEYPWDSGINPTGSTYSDGRIQRGGAYSNPAFSCRAANRVGNASGTRETHFGLRIAAGDREWLRLPHDESKPETQQLLANSYTFLGNVLFQQKRNNEGVTALIEAFRRRVNLAKANQSEDNNPYQMAIIADAICTQISNDGRQTDIAPWRARLLDARRALCEAKPDDAFALNSLAWLLITVEVQSLRSPKEALPLAERAVELSKREQATILDTLAATLGENGRWDEAVATQKEAIKKLPANTAADTKKSYQNTLDRLTEHRTFAPASITNYVRPADLSLKP